MKVPIRLITIVTSFLWVLLIVISVSVVYSLKEMRLNIGKPQITVTQDNALFVNFPVSIVNNGYYNLNNFNISTEILDMQESIIAQGSTFIPVIRAGETLNTTHQIETNLTGLLKTHQNLIFNDTELRVNETIDIGAAGLISIQVSSNITLNWGAPLYNLTFATPQFTMKTASNSADSYTVIIPISFENHACFDLNGTMQLSMYNDKGVSIGTGEIILRASHESSYQTNAQLDVSTAGMTGKGYFEVCFSMFSFNYGPLVIPYG